MVKKGDTLIEVALAIGIFSMVAIAIVAVMSSGTSSSQTALETTLAREEIDAQAEALRFIHSAYLADEYSGNATYADLWGEITGNAIEIGQNGIDASVLQYNPTTCEDIRENDNLKNKAFVINTHALATDPSSAYVTGDFLQPASTYPRLIYDHAPDTESLIDSTTIASTDLYRAEGIYILAVKDPGSTQIVDDSASSVKASSAYYDFYIRTCWYGAGADQASTISTVVRLYSPPSTTGRDSINSDRWTVVYNGNGGPGGEVNYQYLYRDSQTKATNNKDASEWFLFWSTNKNDTETNQNGTIYKPGDVIPFPNSTDSNRSFTLYAIWKGVFINYDLNGGSNGPNQGRCVGEANCAKYQVSSVQPTRPGYKFKGWAYDKNATTATVNPGDTINVSLDGTTLYAVWVPYYTLTFYDTDGTTQLCSYGQENNNKLQVNCGKTPTNPGNNQTFQGWSPDDREPFYKNGNTVTVPESNNRVLKLYPVWRVSIKFSSEGWTPHTSVSSEPSCKIFNYSEPEGSYYKIKKGTTWGKGGKTNTAPSDGYISASGKHIEILDSGIINMQGYCSRGANEWVSYEIGQSDTFELSADMNTAGMSTHPGGSASINIGPISATIEDGKVTSKCQSSTGTQYSFIKGSVIRLKIAKHGDGYSVSVNNQELKTCTVATNNKVEVRYTMEHGDHNCTKIFNVQLTNIDMQQYIKN